MTNAIFGARAKALYQAVAADLKARCVQAFAIKDPGVHFCVRQTIGESMGARGRSRPNPEGGRELVKTARAPVDSGAIFLDPAFAVRFPADRTARKPARNRAP